MQRARWLMLGALLLLAGVGASAQADGPETFPGPAEPDVCAFVIDWETREAAITELAAWLAVLEGDGPAARQAPSMRAQMEGPLAGGDAEAVRAALAGLQGARGLVCARIAGTEGD